MDGGSIGANGNAQGRAAAAHDDLLLHQATRDAGSGEQARIQKAGRDFESILLGTWLQGAEKSFAAAPGGPSEDDDDGDGGGGDQYMSLAMQQLAGTIASSGGMGIARMITQHLAAKSAEGSKLLQK